MRRRFAGSLAVLALAAAIALAGCGGGGGDSSTSATTTSAKQQSTATQKQASQGQKQKRSAEKSKQSSGQSTTGDPLPGAKAVAPGVPVTKGGDNSIQSFGAEAEAGPRGQATATLTAYLSALRDGEWARACAEASRQFKRQLAELVSRARVRGGGDAKKPKGCTATLQALTAGAPKATLRVLSQANEVLSFRVRGNYAYLIYRGAGGKAMFIAMANDDGAWKVNVLKPEEFTEPSQGSSQ